MMKLRHNRWRLTPLGTAMATVLLASCGGGSGDGDSALDGASTATISGTVPGTTIEALADNGGYYVTYSTDNGTLQHPFTLEVPAGMGLRLVMTVNEETTDQVVSPIGFRDNTTQVHTRLVLGAGDAIDIGHVPLAMSRAEAAGDVDGDGDMDDGDGDGVLDSPFMLDDAWSPLAYADADHDGLDDFDDPDRGGYHYADGDQDPLDHDHDGVPNTEDPDYLPGDGFMDADRDGLNDETDDVNPGNVAGMNGLFSDDPNGDGYHQDDANHDGFHDNDMNRDGFPDDATAGEGMHAGG